MPKYVVDLSDLTGFSPCLPQLIGHKKAHPRKQYLTLPCQHSSAQQGPVSDLHRNVQLAHEMADADISVLSASACYACFEEFKIEHTSCIGIRDLSERVVEEDCRCTAEVHFFLSWLLANLGKGQTLEVLQVNCTTMGL